MNTFYLITALTFIISLCFYKKKFWENRYIILGINTCVLIITYVVLNVALKSSFINVTTISGCDRVDFRRFGMKTDTVLKHTWDIEKEKGKFFLAVHKGKPQYYLVTSLDKDKDVLLNMMKTDYQEISYLNTKHYIVKGKTDKAYMVIIHVKPVSHSSWTENLLGLIPDNSGSFIVIPEKDYNKLPLRYKIIIPGYYDRNVLKQL